MRKHRSLFTLLTMTALSLSGCSALLSLFNRNVDVIDLPATEFKTTYNDYLNHNFYQLDGTPLTGSPKLLIVPVWFTNSNSYIPLDQRDQVRQDISDAYLGEDSVVGWKSVRTYYKELSKDKLNLNAFVTDWYECGKPSNSYYASESGGHATLDLVDEAVNFYKSNYSTDMSSFDTDGNGYIDGVILIYASPDKYVMKNDTASNMWAYCFWTQNGPGTASNPVPNAFFWASYDFMYGSKKIGNYAHGDTTYCNIDTHTFIHEMGHMLGLEDYYDYSDQYVPAGAFSMQDFNVGSHDPYSVMAFGWANPMIPTKTCSLSLKPFQSSHDLILLSASPSSISSPFDEYLLLEYYTADGLNEFDVKHVYNPLNQKYPVGPKTGGIRLWHVDARLLKATSREPSAAKYSIEYDIDSRYFYTHAISNTYYSDDASGYITPLYDTDAKYADYNILQLIRQNTKMTYKPEIEDSDSYFSRYDLFTEGDSFKMSSYKKQFVNGEKMNAGERFSWSFKVNKITETEAIVTVTL